MILLINLNKKLYGYELLSTLDKNIGGHEGEVTLLVGLKNGQLASTSVDHTIKIWDIKSSRLRYTFDWSNDGHTNFIDSMVLLPNGNLASGSGDFSVKIWNT